MPKIYQQLATLIQARENCARTGNTVWFDKHTERIAEIVSAGPSGSGIDCGTTISLDQSNAERLVLGTQFHHMDENGSYDGWTSHAIIVRPSLANGFTLSIGGRDRNEIKGYLHDVYAAWLDQNA